MSADTHYSDAPDGTIPKRFLCRRKCKDGSQWTRYEPIVDCTRCLAKMKENAQSSAAQESQK